MAFIYKYYDQFIESEVALNLQSAEAQGLRCLHIALDLTLTYGVTESAQYLVGPKKIEVKSKNYAAILDLESRILRLCPSPTLSGGILTQLLINEVFPIMSFFDGALQLHASAVCSEEDAICFLGHSGTGKSSLAIALVSRGYSLIDDDRVLLRLENREVKVFGNNHPLRLICGNEAGFDICKWQYLGMAEDGKICLMPPVDNSRSNGTCKSYALLRVGDSLQLSQSRLTQNFLAVLECIPLSSFFSEHYGERFMQLLEELFGNHNFFSLIRTEGSDPLFVGDAIEAFLDNSRSPALMLESSKGFV